MKKCPYCANEIWEEAIYCPICGRDVRVPVPPPAYQQPAPGYYPGPGTPYQQVDFARQKAISDASNALTMAIIGIFCFWVIFEPIAIIKARDSKKILQPGDQNYGKAQAAEIIGWVVICIGVLAIVWVVIDTIATYPSY